MTDPAATVLAKIMNRHASNVLFHDSTLADEAWAALAHQTPPATQPIATVGWGDKTRTLIDAWNARPERVEGSAIGRALREVPDETIRRVVDAKDFGKARARIAELMIDILATLHTPPPVALDRYDAGLLGDGGGGDVDWWQDYMRAELERAYEFYSDQVGGEA